MYMRHRRVTPAVISLRAGQQLKNSKYERLLDLFDQHQQNFFDTHVKPYLFESLLKTSG